MKYLFKKLYIDEELIFHLNFSLLSLQSNKLYLNGCKHIPALLHEAGHTFLHEDIERTHQRLEGEGSFEDFLGNRSWTFIIRDLSS